MLSFIKNGTTIVVEDRLYTDMQLAINNNFDSLLVLSGEATMADIETSKIYPTFVVDSVSIVNK